MKLKIFYSLWPLKEDWERLFKLTPEVSPFLNFEAFRISYLYHWPYYLKNRHLPKICVFTQDNKIRAIIPTIQCRDGIHRLFGIYNGFNECGFLYDDIDIVPQCLELLKERFGVFEFHKIDERNPICVLFKYNCGETNNVAIRFQDGYDSWFKSLSSSVRQNIRTAYNRLTTDGLSFQFSEFRGGV